MFRDKDVLQHFPATLKHRNARLFLASNPAANALHAFQTLIDNRHSEQLSRVSAPLEGQEDRLFAKSQPLDSFKPKLRVTFGRAKRDGTYDWPVEEVINTLEAQKRGAPVAPLAGFGYSKSLLGVTQEVFIFTDLLCGYVNGLDWLEEPGNEVETLMTLAFDLLRDLHGKGLSHMDFWANNVMISRSCAQPPKAIDLENCFLTPSGHLSEVLAFQLGFFYRREIYRFITEARYDQRVKEALADYEGIDLPRFERIYALSKHENISRRARREIFHKGTVVTG